MHKNLQGVRLDPVATAVRLAVSAMVVGVAPAMAGSGWGENVDLAGMPFKVQTYHANSPSGLRPDTRPGATSEATVPTGAPLRKFVDTLPGIEKSNNLGQYIPKAVPEKWRDASGNVTNDDYYEIAVVEYQEKMHSDLAKPSTLRGYVQLSTPDNPGKAIPLFHPDGKPILSPLTGQQYLAHSEPHYLGPVIETTRGTAVRLKYVNLLPSGRAVSDAEGKVVRNGDLFLPVDETLVGAGFGPDGKTKYSQNRTSLHLHGGDTPWISDGTPHQWFTPADEGKAIDAQGNVTYEKWSAPVANLLRGESNRNVPDMPDPGPGATTYYFPNNQSARLLWYHDHTLGLTRLNVYAGMAAPFILRDPVEQQLVSQGVLPADEIPLILQDKTFVPLDIAEQDAKWDTAHWGKEGDLWFPHVYETNQDPNSYDGTNPVGRWDYGPWFWPVFPAPLALPSGEYGDASTTPEAFLDTPVINGTAYPKLEVEPKAYRFRILNASNDRSWNLGLYEADPANPAEVKMVPFDSSHAFPTTGGLQGTGWGTPDARAGGVPDPDTVGPDIIQIGNEGGFLPKVVEIPSTPINYEYNRRSVTILNVLERGLFLGNAERADVVIDFSRYAGKTLILYNDAPAPVPATDPRIDYYTGMGDNTAVGGAADVRPGYGPNTRTVMQIVVKPAPDGITPAPFNVAALKTELPKAYAATQPRPVVSASVYNDAFGTQDVNTYAKIATGTLTNPTFIWTPAAAPGETLTVHHVVITDPGLGYNSKPPTVTFTGGLDPTNLNARPAKGTVQVDTTKKQVVGITVTDPGVGYISAPVLIFSAVPGGTGNGAAATAFMQNVTKTTDTTKPVIQTLQIPVQNKAIQELFDPNYGRMNATLGVELPYTSQLTQTTIPLGYVDTMTETAYPDKPQIWKITHNGVDTHPVHIHLMNVQVINRVGWDGTIKPPYDNELGWKETVKMNPLEDIIIALQPKHPKMPFGVPYSERLMDPSQPQGVITGIAQIDVTNLYQFDPDGNVIPGVTNPQGGQPATVTNQPIAFNWEYVWHCHILGHEENDFMRPINYIYKATLPQAVGNLSVTKASDTKVDLSWVDATPGWDRSYNEGSGRVPPATLTTTANEIGFRVQRAKVQNGVTGPYTTVATTLANAQSYTDTVLQEGVYSYKVAAFNAAGATTSQASANVSAGIIPTDPGALKLSVLNPVAVQLAWADNSQIETGYLVQRDGVTIATLPANATSYTDNTATDGVRYTYSVTAFNSQGSSNPVSGSVTIPLAPPTNAYGALTASSGLNRTITVYWQDNSRIETGYRIQRATNASFSQSLITFTVGSNTGSYADTTASASRSTYYYRIYTLKGAEQSTPATTGPVGTQAPMTPTGATLGLTDQTPTGAVGIRFGWTDTSNNETGFVVQRATNWSFSANLQTFNLPAQSTFYVDGGITLGTTYYYRVRATNAAGDSFWLTAGPYTPTLTAPVLGTPTVAAQTDPATVTLTWTDLPYESGYELQRATDAAFIQNVTTLPLAANTTSYSDTGAAVGATYYYRLRALAGTSASGWSATRTIAIPVAPPANVTATAANSTTQSKVVVAWTDPANYETGFTLQRSTNGSFSAGLTTLTVPAGTTSYTDTAVTAGTTYYYRVQTNAAKGSSAWVNSNPASYTAGRLWLPAITQTTTGTLGFGSNNRTVNLAWTESGGTPAITGQAILYSTSSSQGAPADGMSNGALNSGVTTLGGIGSATRSYLITGLARRTTYYFQLRVTNAAGTNYGPVVSVTTP